MLGWMKHKLESKFDRRNINNLRYEDNTTLMAESKELKSLLMKVKEESEKLYIQKTKIMASGPITSWEIDGEIVETVTDFIFWGSKITADGYCRHEIKTLAPWKKSYDQPRQYIKSRDITLPTKVHLVNVLVFPVVMYGCKSSAIKKAFPVVIYGCESGTIKKAEHGRIDAFELWCWRRLLSPLDCKEIQPIHSKGNQS